MSCRPRLWRGGGNLGLAIASALLTALALEAALRLKGQDPERPLGQRLRPAPGLVAWQSNLEFRTVTRISALGFRDREYPLDKGGATRILGLGDSFTFGVGVHEPDTYLARIEAALAADPSCADAPVEVLNAGFPGMNPNDELGVLRREGPGFRPDLVLLGFFVGNDITEMLGERDPGIWRRTLRPGSLAPDPRGQLRGLLGAWRRLLVIQFLNRRFALLRARWGGGGEGPALPTKLTPSSLEALCLRDYPAEFEEGWRLALHALLAVRNWAHEHRARFALVVIPTAAQVDPQHWSEVRRAAGLAAEEFDLDKPQRLLQQLGRDATIPVIDLLPALRSARLCSPERLYYRVDPHWTRRGHRVAAEEILRWLDRAGFCSAGDAPPGRSGP